MYKIELLALILTTYLPVGCSGAQSLPLTEDYKKQTINTISSELEDRYVFPEVAKATTVVLAAAEANGRFVQDTSLEMFAKSLSEVLYTGTRDKHITVSLRPKEINGTVKGEPFENWINQRLEGRSYLRRYNANFKSITKLEDNIGYLDLRGFYGLDKGREFAKHAMAQLSTSDAVIIDLRNNSGGRGDMVEYLLSYFFDEPVIGSKSVKRRGDEFTETISYTPKRSDELSLSDMPLFILTSSMTFSAAEGFSYALQAYDRATFIGDTTKGGANPGDLIPINEELQVFISDVSVTHPLTNGSWEGVGIIPDLPVDSAVALDTALVLAKRAARVYKEEKEEEAKKVLLTLNETVANFSKGMDNKIIVEQYLLCRKHHLIFEEWELNGLGYQLLEQNNLHTAEAIFETNTILYPHSPNTFDSFGEALLKNGKRQNAIKAYQRAVELATDLNHRDLDLFQKNLQVVLKDGE